MQLAKKLERLKTNPERVHEVYLLLFSRPPTEKESREILDLLGKFRESEESLRAWALVCQTLIGTNEFIYLR